MSDMIDLTTFQLQLGDKGPMVLAAKRLLDEAGFWPPELPMDKVYDIPMEETTRRAQQKLKDMELYDSDVDGLFGPGTLKALLLLIGLRTFASDILDAEADLEEDEVEDDIEEEFEEEELEEDDDV